MFVLYFMICNCTRSYGPLAQPHGDILLEALTLNVSLDKNGIS